MERAAKTSLQTLEKRVAEATEDRVKLPTDQLKFPDATAKDLGIEAEVKKFSTSVSGLPEANGLTDARSKVVETMEIPGELDLKALSEKANVAIPGSREIEELSNKVDGLQSKADEIQKYQEEVQNVRENGLQDMEKLPDEVEAQVANIEEVESLQKETAKVAQQQKEYESLIERYKDKKLLQQEIVRKSKNIVNEKINASTPAVKETLKHIDKARKIKPGFFGVRAIMKRWPDNLKNKPLRYRLVPGMTFQVHNQDTFMVDVGVQTGYNRNFKRNTQIWLDIFFK